MDPPSHGSGDPPSADSDMVAAGDVHLEGMHEGEAGHGVGAHGDGNPEGAGHGEGYGEGHGEGYEEEDAVEAPRPSLKDYPELVLVACETTDKFVRCANGNVYMVIRTLAECHFGKVKAACVCVKDEDDNYHRTDQLVALKIMRADLIKKGVSLRGVRCAENPVLELRALQFLGSEAVGACPYILQVHEVLASEDYLIAVLEYAPGGDLFDSLVSRPIKRFTEPEARKAFWELMVATKHMHEHGVAHRDMSIENALLNASGDIKVIDLGLCSEIPTCAGEAGAEMLPFPPGPIGKIGYMAPEVYSRQAYFGTAADMWSCGIMLFILLTGVPPYTLPEMSDQRFSMVVRGQVLDLLAAWRMADWFSEEAKDLLFRILQRDPGERPTAAAVLEHPWLVHGPLGPAEPELPPGGAVADDESGAGAGAGAGAGFGT